MCCYEFSCNMLQNYPKCILMLCLWGVACSAYYFWNTAGFSWYRYHYLPRFMQPNHTQALFKPPPPANRMGLGLGHGADGHIKTSSSSLSSSPSSSSSSSSPPSTKEKVDGGNSSASQRMLPGKLLCIHFTGRLGNELFEYASTLGLALTLNRTAVFLGSQHLPKVLKVFREVMVVVPAVAESSSSSSSSTSPVAAANFNGSEVRARCNRARVMAEATCCKYKKEMAELDPRFDYRVVTYLQSYRYFENHKAAIRKALTFNDRIGNSTDKIVRELRRKYPSSTLVGMHIRHGDMATPNSQRLGYPVADPGYMKRSVGFFQAVYSNCTFVVASDSLDWVKANFPANGTRVHFLGNNEPAVDMSVLASMDHVVISFGTFSWWIGYLNRGKTVYMKDFIRINTFIGHSFNPGGRDYIYPRWIPL